MNYDGTIPIGRLQNVIEIIVPPPNIASQSSHVDGPIVRVLEGNAAGPVTTLDGCGGHDL